MQGQNEIGGISYNVSLSITSAILVGLLCEPVTDIQVVGLRTRTRTGKRIDRMLDPKPVD